MAAKGVVTSCATILFPIMVRLRTGEAGRSAGMGVSDNVDDVTGEPTTTVLRKGSVGDANLGRHDLLRLALARRRPTRELCASGQGTARVIGGDTPRGGAAIATPPRLASGDQACKNG